MILCVATMLCVTAQFTLSSHDHHVAMILMKDKQKKIMLFIISQMNLWGLDTRALIAVTVSR